MLFYAVLLGLLLIFHLLFILRDLLNSRLLYTLCFFNRLKQEGSKLNTAIDSVMIAIICILHLNCDIARWTIIVHMIYQCALRCGWWFYQLYKAIFAHKGSLADVTNLH